MGSKCLHDVLLAEFSFGESVEKDDLCKSRFVLGFVPLGLDDPCDGSEPVRVKDVAGCGGELRLRWRCKEALVVGDVAWRLGWTLLRRGLVRVRRCNGREVRFEEGHTCCVPVHNGVLAS